jgi:hypothetical protein
MPRFSLMPLVLLSSAVVTVVYPAEGKNPNPRIPDGSYEVTYQMKEEGKLGRGLHFLDLSCWDQECSLTTLSLNQCSDSGLSALLSGKSDSGFFPKVERTSTTDGDLNVIPIGDSTLMIEQTMWGLGGEAKMKFRLEYHKGSGLPYVKSFSGAMIKDSSVLKKVITIEFVPLTGRLVPKVMDCPTLLPGVVEDHTKP